MEALTVGHGTSKLLQTVYLNGGILALAGVLILLFILLLVFYWFRKSTEREQAREREEYDMRMRLVNHIETVSTKNAENYKNITQSFQEHTSAEHKYQAKQIEVQNEIATVCKKIHDSLVDLHTGQARINGYIDASKKA